MGGVEFFFTPFLFIRYKVINLANLYKKMRIHNVRGRGITFHGRSQPLMRINGDTYTFIFSKSFRNQSGFKVGNLIVFDIDPETKESSLELDNNSEGFRLQNTTHGGFRFNSKHLYRTFVTMLQLDMKKNYSFVLKKTLDKNIWKIEVKKFTNESKSN